MKYARPRKLLAALVATAMMSLGVGGALAPPGIATTPGTPGTVQPGTTVYVESFSNEDATAGAISILRYEGGPAAANETYTADTPYTPAGGQCDGWILNSFTPLPTSDSGCLRNQPAGWSQLQQMSVALGLAQGQTPAQAAHNQALSEYTNSASGSLAAGVQFRTESNTIPAIAGHYYAASGYFAQVNCHAAHASQTFSLLINGTRQVLSAGLDPCGSSTRPDVQVTRLQSAAYQIPAGTINPSLGLEVRNEATTGFGNDVAFDLPQIVDVTPQLDNSFTPSLIGPGGTSRVTFTVTNTEDLASKNDWFLTDTLPAGVVVAHTPNVGGTCVQAPGTNALVRTADAGSTTISVAGGDLAQGMSSCTITVDVTAAAEGAYVNRPAAVVTNLTPPADATLTVLAPRLELSKQLDGPRARDSDQFATEIRTGSATGPVVSNTANSTTTGSGATVTAGTGVTGEYIATAGTTYYLTESGSNLSGYDETITCTDANGLQPGLPNGEAFNASLALVPVTGADISCVLTGRAVAAPDLDFSASADTSAIHSPAVVGDRITYTFASKNTGNVKLTDVAVDDSLAGPSALNYSWPGIPGELLPGESVTAVATYAITQADIDAGQVANSANTTGNPPTGPPLTPPPSDIHTALAASPGMQFSNVAKAPAADGEPTVGDIITYYFTSKNSGNATLKNVSIDDTRAGLSALTYSWPGTPGTLLPGQAVTASATYAITQADIDAGHVANSATTTGTPFRGPSVTPPPGETDTPLKARSGLEFTKTADASGVGDPARAGDVITYKFTVKNTGSVPMTAVAVTDQMLGLSALDYHWPGASGTLMPGETVTATAAYAITRADTDAGTVSNSATATGTSSTGSRVTTPPATVVVTFPPVAATAGTSPAGSAGNTPAASTAGGTAAGTSPTGTSGTTPPASAVVTAPSVVPGQSEGPLASTGVVLTVVPISVLVVGSGLLLFLVGRRRRSEA
jgi:uncharacterized repeat protein (TIGR01451 family)